MIDNESLADILFYDAFVKMGLFQDWLTFDSPLVSLSRIVVPVKGVKEGHLLVDDHGPSFEIINCLA